jgi:hypothetical protein
MPKFQENVLINLCKSTSVLSNSSELLSAQVLASIDQLSCAVISSWLNLYSMENVVQTNSEFKKEMDLVNLQAIHGTMSDIVDKTGFPHRMYYVADALIL